MEGPVSTRPTMQVLREVAPTISVGMLTADLACLGAELDLLERSGTRLVHYDVMDGRFCPALTFGAPLVAAARTSLLKDVHLMIEEPLDKLAEFVAAGADVITIHVEATRHPLRALQALGGMTNANEPARGLVRGIALNPGTPLAAVEPLLGDVELILVLAVNPGWGGQTFAATTERRLAQARELIAASGRDVLLGVDGGVRRENLKTIAAMRPDIIVTGSAVFDGKSAEANARFMLETLRAPRVGAA
jgi:ribulose-phosphate 3-epimerase